MAQLNFKLQFLFVFVFNRSFSHISMYLRYTLQYRNVGDQEFYFIEEGRVGKVINSYGSICPLVSLKRLDKLIHAKKKKKN